MLYRKYILVLLLAFAFQPFVFLFSQAGAKQPDWLAKTVTDRGNFIYVVGASRSMPSEEEAKNDALCSATETFVKYCGMDVQTFDRIMELYSTARPEKDAVGGAGACRLLRAAAFAT